MSLLFLDLSALAILQRLVLGLGVFSRMLALKNLQGLDQAAKGVIVAHGLFVLSFVLGALRPFVWNFVAITVTNSAPTNLISTSIAATPSLELQCGENFSVTHLGVLDGRTFAVFYWR